MKKRKLDDFSPERRRANRMVLVSAIISAVITGIMHIAVNTLLFIDDVSHTILGVFQILTIIGAFIWFGFALRTGSVLAIFTIIGMIMFTLMMGNNLLLTVPFAITDTLKVDGYTYYLVESYESRQGVAKDSFFIRELYRCEGDSRRMRDCKWLWYETDGFFDFREQTVLYAYIFSGTVQVQAGFKQQWRLYGQEFETIYTPLYTYTPEDTP